VSRYALGGWGGEGAKGGLLRRGGEGGQREGVHRHRPADRPSLTYPPHPPHAQGKKFFDAPSGYGAFVRPDKVEAGDFPPIDEFGSDLGSDDEI
jgi:hypothetical protein